MTISFLQINFILHLILVNFLSLLLFIISLTAIFSPQNERGGERNKVEKENRERQREREREREAREGDEKVKRKKM